RARSVSFVVEVPHLVAPGSVSVDVLRFGVDVLAVVDLWGRHRAWIALRLAAGLEALFARHARHPLQRACTTAARCRARWHVHRKAVRTLQQGSGSTRSRILRRRTEWHLAINANGSNTRAASSAADDSNINRPDDRK